MISSFSDQNIFYAKRKDSKLLSRMRSNCASGKMSSAIPFGLFFAVLPPDLSARVVQHLPPSVIVLFAQTCHAALDLVLHNPLCWRLHLPPSLFSPSPSNLHQTALAISHAPRNRPYTAAHSQSLSFTIPNDTRGEGVVVAVPAGNSSVAPPSAGARVGWQRVTAATGLEGGGAEWLCMRNSSVVDWRSTLRLPRGTYTVSVRIGAMGVWRVMKKVLILVNLGERECSRIEWVVGYPGRLVQEGFRRLDLGGVSVGVGDVVEVRAFSDRIIGRRELTFGTVEAVLCGASEAGSVSECQWRSYRDAGVPN